MSERRRRTARPTVPRRRPREPRVWKVER